MSSHLISPPVLFLDFDGVVHALGEPALDEDFHLLDNPNLFAWLPILEEVLFPFPNVQIIISSDWRRLVEDENLIRLLGPLGPRFLGVVEIFGATRAEEVLREAQRRRLTHWLAIDDHPSVAIASSQDARFIVCEPETGLSSELVQSELRLKLSELSNF